MRSSDSYKKFCEIDAKYKERLDEELRKKQEEEDKIVCEQLDIITKAISDSLEKDEFQNYVYFKLPQGILSKTKCMIRDIGWTVDEKYNCNTHYTIRRNKDALVLIN